MAGQQYQNGESRHECRSNDDALQAVGRQLARPGNSLSDPTLSIEYHDVNPYWTEARQKIDSSTTLKVRKFYDATGELVQTQTVGASVNGSTRDIITDYYPRLA